jgi:hypothetical protein
MIRILFIVVLFSFASCASYVPKTESKGKRVIRQLEIENRANTQRIQAIANTYSLSATIKTREIRQIVFPEIKISEAVPFNILPNRQIDNLIDSLVKSVRENKPEEFNRIKTGLKDISFDRQVFDFEDEYLKAVITLDPGLLHNMNFEYTIKERSKEETIEYEQQIIDAGKKYYQHFQFWAVLFFWILSILLIIRLAFIFRI